jgi:Family of unknown function (DUF6159)
MGFFTHITRGFSFIKHAYTMGFENKRLFLPSVFLVLATIVYILIWIGVMVATKIDFEGQTGQALGAVCTFGSFLVFFFFMGMTVHVVDKHLEGKEFTMGEAFQDAVQNFAAIAMLALISTLIELLSKAARQAAQQKGGAAIVGSILMSIVESIWTVASYLLLPIIIIEDIGFGDAMKRASGIYKGKLLPIAVGEVGVRFAANIVTFLVLLPLFFFVAPLLFAINPIFGLIVIGFVIAMMASFQVFVRMAYYTCLYHWAVETEKAGSSVRAPGPLGLAMAG